MDWLAEFEDLMTEEEKKALAAVLKDIEESAHEAGYEDVDTYLNEEFKEVE